MDRVKDLDSQARIEQLNREIANRKQAIKEIEEFDRFRIRWELFIFQCRRKGIPSDDIKQYIMAVLMDEERRKQELDFEIPNCYFCAVPLNASVGLGREEELFVWWECPKCYMAWGQDEEVDQKCIEFMGGTEYITACLLEAYTHELPLPIENKQEMQELYKKMELDFDQFITNAIKKKLGEKNGTETD